VADAVPEGIAVQRSGGGGVLLPWQENLAGIIAPAVKGRVRIVTVGRVGPVFGLPRLPGC
jgi:hypothetical protein